MAALARAGASGAGGPEGTWSILVVIQGVDAGPCAQGRVLVLGMAAGGLIADLDQALAG